MNTALFINATTVLFEKKEQVFSALLQSILSIKNVYCLSDSPQILSFHFIFRPLNWFLLT